MTIIARCWKLADRHGVRLRRRYTKLVRQSLLAQRWRQHPKRRKEARRGVRFEIGRDTGSQPVALDGGLFLGGALLVRAMLA